MKDKPINMGSDTKWGKIIGIGFIGGERYYWMQDKHGAIAMMPWSVVEAE